MQYLISQSADGCDSLCANSALPETLYYPCQRIQNIDASDPFSYHSCIISIGLCFGNVSTQDTQAVKTKETTRSYPPPPDPTPKLHPHHLPLTLPHPPACSSLPSPLQLEWCTPFTRGTSTYAHSIGIACPPHSPIPTETIHPLNWRRRTPRRPWVQRDTSHPRPTPMEVANCRWAHVVWRLWGRSGAR